MKEKYFAKKRSAAEIADAIRSLIAMKNGKKIIEDLLIDQGITFQNLILEDEDMLPTFRHYPVLEVSIPPKIGVPPIDKEILITKAIRGDVLYRVEHFRLPPIAAADATHLVLSLLPAIIENWDGGKNDINKNK